MIKKGLFYKNELVNKEFLSPQISTARKSFLRHLLNNESLENLGFPNDKFPPEKSIYLTLLKKTGIHKLNNGVGILNEHLEKIFTQFFKSKNHHGSGLGLFIVKEALNKINGRIAVNSSIKFCQHLSNA